MYTAPRAGAISILEKEIPRPLEEIVLNLMLALILGSHRPFKPRRCSKSPVSWVAVTFPFFAAAGIGFCESL
jgi:hypothetical protein